MDFVEGCQGDATAGPHITGSICVSVGIEECHDYQIWEVNKTDVKVQDFSSGVELRIDPVGRCPKIEQRFCQPNDKVLSFFVVCKKRWQCQFCDSQVPVVLY